MIIDFQNDSSFFFRLIYKHWEPVISPGDLHLGYVRAYNVVQMLPVSFNRHVLLAYGVSYHLLRATAILMKIF